MIHGSIPTTDCLCLQMLDKSKMDTAKAWAGIEATEERLQKVDTLFSKIRKFNSGDNQTGLQIKLDRTTGAFISYFPERDRPAMYAWMSVANPAEVQELEKFTQDLFDMGQQQQFALVPRWGRLLFNRLVGTQAPTIPMDRRGSLMNAYLSPADQVFTLHEVVEDSDEDFDSPHAVRSPRSPHRAGSGGLSDQERREQQTCEEGLRLIREKGAKCMQFMETGRVGSDKRHCGLCRCRFRVFTVFIMALSAAFLVVVALLVQYFSAGCCPAPETLPQWNEAGFGLNSKVQKCDSAQQQRGSTCIARCRTGYVAAQASNNSFVCADSTNPTWGPIDPSSPPRCVKDGCYTPDETAPKCQHLGTCRSAAHQPPGYAFPFNFSATNYTCECPKNAVGKHCEYCTLGFTGQACDETVCAPASDGMPFCRHGGKCVYAATCIASEGISSSGASSGESSCCAASCGVCESVAASNGSCTQRPGGASKCCADAIASENVTCGSISSGGTVLASAPCVVDKSLLVSEAGDEVRCECVDGYTGDRCQIGPPPPPPPPPPSPTDHTHLPSCLHIRNNNTVNGVQSHTGTYPISPGDLPPANATCEMTFDGGGWTAIFISEVGDNLHYTVDSLLLRKGSTNRVALMGFVDKAGNLNLTSSWAMFPIPIDWASAAPMQYLRRSTQVTGLLGGHGQAGTGPYTFDLVYGFAGFAQSAQECSAKNWLPTAEYSGQIGMDIHLAEETQARWTPGHTAMMYYDIRDDRPAYPCGGTMHGDMTSKTDNFYGLSRTIETMPWQTITLAATATWGGYPSHGSQPSIYLYAGVKSGSSCTGSLFASWSWSTAAIGLAGHTFTVSPGNRVCVHFGGTNYNSGYALHHSFTATITCSAAPSPWFNNFATGPAGTTPAVQTDRRQVHCNDKSTKTPATTEMCEPSKRFALFVREVDCSEKPDEACASLRRSPCFNTTNTCGRCLHGFNSAVAGDSNMNCLADCSDGPSCAALHRAECVPDAGHPNTCGSCGSRFVGADGPSNGLCTPGAALSNHRLLASADGASSCAEILRERPGAKSGLYSITKGLATVTVLCEMSATADGGGWTALFVAGDADNREYTLSSDLRHTATDNEVMMAFVDYNGALVTTSNRAQFLMPDDWTLRPPMQYLRGATQVDATINSDGPFPLDIIYGASGFAPEDNECSASHWSSAGLGQHHGQLCIDVPTAASEQLAPSLDIRDTLDSFNALRYHPMYPCGGTMHGDMTSKTDNFYGLSRTIETMPWQTITLAATATWGGYPSHGSQPSIYLYAGVKSGSSCTGSLFASWSWSTAAIGLAGHTFTVSPGNRVCVHFGGTNYNSGYALHHSFTATITCSAAPSPWFNNFATGPAGTTPAVQTDRRQVHCNDKSSGMKWDQQSCEVNKRFAIFTRPVTCSTLDHDCTSLHRAGCFSTKNPCGGCLPGFEGAPGDGNTACSTANATRWQPRHVATPKAPAADCSALHGQPTGAYHLGSGTAAYVSLCNMDVAGGGWTAVFVGGSSVDNLHYAVEPTQIASETAFEALIGFVDSSLALMPGHARFLLPARWRKRPPMTYVQQHKHRVEVTVNNGPAREATLVYGFSDFARLCDYKVMPSSAVYNGSLCFMGIDAPWWNGFASGAWDGVLSSASGTQYCNSKAGGFDQTPCSDDRRFAIFVRPIVCSAIQSKAGQSVDCAADLHREGCYDKANTCGNCTSGFTGVSGHSNEPCVADCSGIDGIDGAVCSSLHRSPCAATASGQPNTCGQCLDGYSGAAGYSNTVCTLTSLRGKTPASCYEIFQADPQARTGQYQIALASTDEDEGAVAYCEMTMNGGGWTSIFVSDSARCNGKQPRPRPGPPLYEEPNAYLDTCYRDNHRYTMDALLLRTGRRSDGTETDREVMIGLIDQSGGIIYPESRARFLMPQQWKDAAPMSFLRQHNNVLATIGESKEKLNTTVVYGYADFFTDGCSFDGMKDAHVWDKAHKNEAGGNTVPNLYKGQICLTGGGVWWNNFSVGAEWGGSVSSVQMGPGHCNAPTSKWDLTNCSSAHRFAIFVRPIDCTRAGHCAALNRSQCFDIPNTCGNSLLASRSLQTVWWSDLGTSRALRTTLRCPQLCAPACIASHVQRLCLACRARVDRACKVTVLGDPAAATACAHRLASLPRSPLARATRFNSN